MESRTFDDDMNNNNNGNNDDLIYKAPYNGRNIYELSSL